MAPKLPFGEPIRQFLFENAAHVSRLNSLPTSIDLGDSSLKLQVCGVSGNWTITQKWVCMGSLARAQLTPAIDGQGSSNSR